MMTARPLLYIAVMVWPLGTMAAGDAAVPPRPVPLIQHIKTTIPRISQRDAKRVAVGMTAAQVIGLIGNPMTYGSADPVDGDPGAYCLVTGGIGSEYARPPDFAGDKTWAYPLKRKDKHRYRFPDPTFFVQFSNGRVAAVWEGVVSCMSMGQHLQVNWKRSA